MAIGLGTALIGSAIIGGATSAIGASKNSKAINKATNAQTESNAQSLALQREIYGQNSQNIAPYNYRGNQAGDAINALLGLGTSANMPQQQPAQPQAQPNALAQFGGSTPLNQWWDALAAKGNAPTAQPTQPAPQSSGQPITAQSQANAFQRFRDSTGYQFRLGEGYDAINSGYAANGLLQSGAAQKALLKYGQDYGSNEFGNYIGYLSNQQGVGLSGASALAGVGQNYANNVSSINSANANAISNGAMAKAANTNALLGNISSSFGTALGGFARI